MLLLSGMSTREFKDLPKVPHLVRVKVMAASFVTWHLNVLSTPLGRDIWWLFLKWLIKTWFILPSHKRMKGDIFPSMGMPFSHSWEKSRVNGWWVHLVHLDIVVCFKSSRSLRVEVITNVGITFLNYLVGWCTVCLLSTQCKPLRAGTFSVLFAPVSTSAILLGSQWIFVGRWMRG